MGCREPSHPLDPGPAGCTASVDGFGPGAKACSGTPHIHLGGARANSAAILSGLFIPSPILSLTHGRAGGIGRFP